MPLSDPACTPGTIDPTRGQNVLCADSFDPTQEVVDDTTRQRIAAAYGADPRSGEYQIDLLIPARLGGTAKDANLWPMLAAGARLKARVGQAEARQMCANRITLVDAQRLMATDWTAVLQRVQAELPPEEPATP